MRIAHLKAFRNAEDRLNWYRDLDDPNDSEDDWGVHIASGMEQDNSIDDPDCPEQRDLSAAPNVPGLIRPTRKSKRQAETVLMMVSAIETWRNKGVKTSMTKCANVSPASLCMLN